MRNPDCSPGFGSNVFQGDYSLNAVMEAEGISWGLGGSFSFKKELAEVGVKYGLAPAVLAGVGLAVQYDIGYAREVVDTFGDKITLDNKELTQTLLASIFAAAAGYKELVEFRKTRNWGQLFWEFPLNVAAGIAVGHYAPEALGAADRIFNSLSGYKNMNWNEWLHDVGSVSAVFASMGYIIRTSNPALWLATKTKDVVGGAKTRWQESGEKIDEQQRQKEIMELYERVRKKGIATRGYDEAAKRLGAQGIDDFMKAVGASINSNKKK